MKVRIYRKGVAGDRVYVMTTPDSLYSTQHGKKRYKYRTLDLPKGVVQAIMKCSIKQQSKIAKMLYKGLKKK